MDNRSELSREEKWKQDLDCLANELPNRHKDLFFQITETAFRQAVTRVDKSIPSMKDYEVIVNMAQIVAMVGDGHTRLVWEKVPGLRFYPLRLYWFDDGLYVLESLPEYHMVLGSRIRQIGGADIAEALDVVRPLIPCENEAQVRNWSPQCLLIAEILQALKISSDKESARFTLANKKGDIFECDILPLPLVRLSQLEFISVLDSSEIVTPLYLKRPSEYYWFEYLEDSHTLYFQYNACTNMDTLPLLDFCETMFAYVESHSVQKLIFDVRNNGGGNSQVAEPFILRIKEHSILNQKGHLFVIVGRQTFSSAILNALQLRNETNALIAGEPTGGKPNHFGEVRGFNLPHSGIEITYSTKYFTTAKEDTPSLMPDIDVKIQASDYFSGRDPVLEAILTYQE